MTKQVEEKQFSARDVANVDCDALSWDAVNITLTPPRIPHFVQLWTKDKDKDSNKDTKTKTKTKTTTQGQRHKDTKTKCAVSITLPASHHSFCPIMDERAEREFYCVRKSAWPRKCSNMWISARTKKGQTRTDKDRPGQTRADQDIPDLILDLAFLFSV